MSPYLTIYANASIMKLSFVFHTSYTLTCPRYCVHQDIEEGLNGEIKMTTAEAIDTLVNSYKASAYMEKVTRQIADTREAVSHRSPF